MNRSTPSNDVKRAALHALRHYVPFSYYARSPEIMALRNGVAYPCICSAFIMEARGIWYLLTAGHVFDEIDDHRRNGIELLNFRLWDGWGPGATDQNYIPFDFDAPPKFRLNRDGMDYGIIPLSPLAVAALRANAVVPIGEERYQRNWPDDFDGYAMIGTPAETLSLEPQGGRSTRLSQSVYVLELEEELTPPSELLTPFPRFYGRILSPEQAPE